MADKNIVKTKKAERRRRRVRGRVIGNADRPRMTVARSLRNIYVQIVDDVSKRTVVGVGSSSKIMQEMLESGDSKTVVAKKVGLKAAELAKSKGIETVVFDRNCHRYHGRIKAVADGAREGGLNL